MLLHAQKDHKHEALQQANHVTFLFFNNNNINSKAVFLFLRVCSFGNSYLAWLSIEQQS